MDEKVLGSTVRIDLTTHNLTGALVAPSSAFASNGSDFRIYKDGSASEKTTTNGITVASPFDSIVGKHLIEINTSNSTGDAGFWLVGAEYRIELHSEKTIAGLTQNGVTVGRFRLVSADVLRSLGANAPANWFNAASISADAGAEIAALVEAYIVNEGDATAVMQAIANLIAADWVAGDASPLAIAAAVWAAGSRTITGGSLTTSPPTAVAIADEVQTRTIARVTLVDVCTENTDMRGTDGALTTLGATAPSGWLHAAAFASGAFDAVWTVTTRGLSEAVVLDTATRVNLAADQPDYAPLKAPALRGNLTLAEAVDLILAGVLGVSSQPSGTTEKFKFVDAVDAFATTFDTAGNRTDVSIL